MQISFTPTRCDTALTATRQGDVLTLNGEAFDFTALSEGDVMPRDAVACDWLASEVTCEGGTLHLTLILPHGARGNPLSASRDTDRRRAGAPAAL